MADHLLPPNATELERALARAIDQGLPLDPPVHTLWGPYQCPTQHLPWLAWAVGVEEWGEDWPESVKRDVIAATPEIRRHRGSVWAVREALRAAGYAGATIEEGLPALRYDGSFLYNGQDDYSGGSRWALFKLTADIGENQGVGNEELDRLIRLVNRAKPVRSKMREVGYQATVADDAQLSDAQQVTVDHTLAEVRPAGLRYDGSINYDQATKLARAPQHYDGSALYDGFLAYDGLEPQHSWDVTGHRYDNDWDWMSAGLEVALEDEQEVIEVLYDGRGAYEGALTYGGPQPLAVDAAALEVTWRRRHNGRLSYNGAHRYQGSAPDAYAF